MSDRDARRLAKVVLEDGPVIRRSPEVEHERRVAIFDLLEENDFGLVKGREGPYHLTIELEENRLIFDVRDTADAKTWGARALGLADARDLVRSGAMTKEGGDAALDTYFHQIHRSGRSER